MGHGWLVGALLIDEFGVVGGCGGGGGWPLSSFACVTFARVVRLYSFCRGYFFYEGKEGRR